MRYVWITLLCVLLVDVTSSDAAPFLYVADQAGNAVSVIDTATNTVTATVNVGLGPGLIEAHPFGTFVYVHNGLDGTISVIDTSSNSVVSTVSKLQESVLQVDRSSVHDMAVHPAGTFLYTVNFVAISVIDAVNHVFIEEIDVPGDPAFITVHPAGTFLYVVDFGESEVIVIDTVTQTVVARVPVDPFPWTMAVHPDGRFLYVGSRANSTVSVIDTAMNTVVETVFVGPDKGGIVLWDIQVHPDGTFVYVRDIGTQGSIYVIDTASNIVVGTIPLSGSYLALHPDGTRLYAARDRENAIAVIDTATNTVIDATAVNVVVWPFPDGFAIAQPAPRQISGCVDRGGVPLVQHKVTLKQTDEEKQKTTTDMKGCYAFESIASGKTFKVIIKGPAVP